MRIARNIFQEIAALGHDEDFEPPLPEVAVDYKPGSWEKICTFADRVKRGEALFHPDDFTEHVCTHEQAMESLPKVQAAVGMNRTSKEFIKRQEKLARTGPANKKQMIKPKVVRKKKTPVEKRLQESRNAG